MTDQKISSYDILFLKSNEIEQCFTFMKGHVKNKKIKGIKEGEECFAACFFNKDLEDRNSDNYKIYERHDFSWSGRF